MANKEKKMESVKKIFILHGWTYTTDKWTDSVLRLNNAGYEVRILPVPGLTGAIDSVWTLDDYIGWLDKQLRAEVRPILIGHSNGGRIALAFAARYPDKLGKLILVASAGIYHNELSLRVKRVVFGALAKLGRTLTTSRVARGFLYKLAGESDYKNATPQMRETMNNLITVDLTDRLDSIVTPTLLIWGDDDKLTPIGDGIKIKTLIKNSEMYVINSAGHSPHFTHVTEVTRRIINYLQS